MYKFLLVVCLAQAALGSFNVKFNTLLDGQLTQVNAVLSQQGAHSVPLGDQSMGGATVKGITISDIATIQRIGDADMQATDDTTLQVTSSVGLKNMVVHVDSYANGQQSFTNASFQVQTNEVSWGYSIAFTAAGGCSISVQKLEVTDLDKVTMFSDDPKMNNIDVSAQFQQVKTVINQYLQSPQFIALIEQHDPCKGNSAWTKLFAF